ncbi:MAG TPA: SMP-30/gluconolactonase/LRE family protein [Ilumatobacteraceae bacterium]|nr:SMP-30/gluconolactonase/LRE family protein [Ilumatobacteraceae bacterium]
MAGDDRWSAYSAVTPSAATGWRFDVVTPPSRLGGANGMTFGPDGRLYVTQVFGSQITAIDIETGRHDVGSPLGAGITGPDDAIFGADGTLYATEPMFGRVTARESDGTYRVVRADLPAANGCTMDHARRRLFIDEFRPGGRLLEVDPTGQAEPRVLLDDLAGPNAPAMGPDGKLYFPQVFADEIWSYDLDTGATRLVIGGIPRPTAVKFDSRGRIVTSVAGAGQILAVDVATGAQEVLAEVPLGIDNVSVGPDDRIFVSHFVDGRVAEETAGRQRVLSPPGLLGPHGLAVGADGTILFADGLSTGTVVDGVAERHHRLLVDLPTLAVGVAPFADAVVVLGATGELLRYDGSGAPTVLAAGLLGATALRVDGDRLLVADRANGRITAVGRDGAATVVLDGVAAPASVDRCGDGYVIGAGTAVLVVDGTGNETRIDGFGDAQGVAAIGSQVLVADAARHELVIVDTSSGRRDVVVSGAPVGSPVDGAVVPAAFAAITVDGAGGYLVGCNGDGSIRRLTPAA